MTGGVDYIKEHTEQTLPGATDGGQERKEHAEQAPPPPPYENDHTSRDSLTEEKNGLPDAETPDIIAGDPPPGDSPSDANPPDGDFTSGAPLKEKEKEKEPHKEPAAEPAQQKARQPQPPFQSPAPRRSGGIKLPPRAASAIRIAAGLALGAAAGRAVSISIRSGRFTPAELFLSLLLLILSLFIYFNLYNLGSLAASLAAGGRTLVFAAACLRFAYSGKKPVFSFDPRRFFCGQCVCLPPSGKPASAGRFIAFYAGGTALCAAWTAACFVLYLFGADFAGFFIISAVAGLLFLALRLAPLFWDGAPSDGYILLEFLKKSGRAALFAQIRSASAQDRAGIRPSDVVIPDINPVALIREGGRPAFKISSVRPVLKALLAASQKKALAALSSICENLLRLACSVPRLPMYRVHTNRVNAAHIESKDKDDVSAKEAAEILLYESESAPAQQDGAAAPQTQAENEHAPEPVTAREAENHPDKTDKTDKADGAEETDGADETGETEIKAIDIQPPPEAHKTRQKKKESGRQPSPSIKNKIKRTARGAGALTAAFIEKAKKIKPRPSGHKISYRAEPFPSPAPDNGGSLVPFLLLKLRLYYRSLDRAEREDMYSHLEALEKNLPLLSPDGRLTRTACFELCFYYSINRNAAAAAHYLAEAESEPEFVGSADAVTAARSKAYYELYINKNHKNAFNICREALDSRAARKGSGFILPKIVGVTAMDADLMRVLINLIHQKTSAAPPKTDRQKAAPHEHGEESKTGAEEAK